MVNKDSVIPKVAVITRTKNRNILLKRALKSVQSQTFRDFIQVVINDGGNKKEVEELTSQYPSDNLIVIHNKESVGLTKALNQGVKAVNSTYIAILDDDDTWSNDRLELAVSFLETSGSKGVVNVMDNVIEEIGDKGDVKFISQDRVYSGVTLVSLYKQCLDNYMTHNCFTYRRDVYDELAGYDERLAVAEDWDFGIRFLLKYDVDFLNTKHALSFYHHRPAQKGDLGNSVFAGVDTQRYQINALLNKYLREDINDGRLGVGYIMNDLRYGIERYEHRTAENLLNVIRLEGHVNYSSDRLYDRLSVFFQDGRFYRALKKVINASGIRKIIKPSK